MKTGKYARWCAGFLAVGFVVGMTAVGTLPVQAAGTETEELRQRAQDLERKAQDLKADGRHEEAKQIMTEVEEIRANTKRAEKGQSPQGMMDDPRRFELKRKLTDSVAELKELRAAGKREEAAEVKRRVQELEKELAGLGRRPAKQKGLKREGWVPRPGKEGPRPYGPERPEAPRRLQHLQVAIDNLHAAGMHEPAEQLSREAQHMRQELQAARPTEPGRPGQPGPELERLRAEVQELRQAVRELRARLDDLSRQRP